MPHGFRIWLQEHDIEQDVFTRIWPKVHDFYLLIMSQGNAKAKTSSSVYIELADYLLAEGEADCSRMLLEKALTCIDGDTKALFFVNFGLAELELHKYKRFTHARAYILKALALEPMNALSHVVLGDVLAIGYLNFDGAAQAYNKALELEPENQKVPARLSALGRQKFMYDIRSRGTSPWLLLGMGAVGIALYVTSRRALP